MKMFYILLTVLILIVSTPSFAKLSCNELDKLAETLDDLAEELTDVRSIGMSGEMDDALGELTDVLNEVALYENDKRLSNWIQNLEIAWEDMEREDFEEALDDIIDRLDGMYDRDCTRRNYTP